MVVVPTPVEPEEEVNDTDVVFEEEDGNVVITSAGDCIRNNVSMLVSLEI